MSYGSVIVPSTFPIAQRPIYVHPIATFSRKNEAEAIPAISAAVIRILNKHVGVRVLVHTVSYKFNDTLYRFVSRALGSSRAIVTYKESSAKQAAIDYYLYEESSVLLAPSLDRGIDLPQDSCRAIVVCKVPFPSLGDKQVSARLHSPGGRLWYNVRTVRSLVQMTGRGMRSATDSCESYILDRQFMDMIWRQNKNLLPKWWRDALVFQTQGL